MIGPEHEAPRPSTGPGFSDWVTFAFGDAEAELYGIARLGLAPQDARASALAVLFSGGAPVAARVEGGAEESEPGWNRIEVAGVSARTLDPLAAWEVGFEHEAGGFSLAFSAASPPLDFGPDAEASRAGGIEGYEQLCRVEGEARVDGSVRPVGCLGQRGHGWGRAPWERIDLARTVSAWLEGPRGMALSAVRPADADGHDEEALTAFLVEPDGEGVTPILVEEPRLSTTYDSEGRQRRAGLELWVGADDELPRRLSGEAVCGTSLELGRLRLDCAFFHWTMEGEGGVGRYDVLRRA